MARLPGRCTEPFEYCDWLSSTDKLAYGTTSAQQSFSGTYGWQLADSMFFPINPRSGCIGSHASRAVRGGGQLRETRACGNQPSGGWGGRHHRKERERWVIKTNAPVSRQQSYTPIHLTHKHVCPPAVYPASFAIWALSPSLSTTL